MVAVHNGFKGILKGESVVQLLTKINDKGLFGFRLIATQGVLYILSGKTLLELTGGQ